MNKLLLLCGVLLTGIFAHSQAIGIDVETVATHTGMVGDTYDLTDYTTYRVYVQVTNPDDFVTNIFAFADSTLQINVNGGVLFQHEQGGDFGAAINAGFFDLLPALEYDSWFTIGQENSDDPGSVSFVTSDSDPWVMFNEGTGFFLTDGGIFTTNSEANVNALPVDDGNGNLRVLLAQFTTNGVVSGIFNVQTIINGEPGNFVLDVFPFSSEGDVVFGCTDEAALNYDAAADTDDASCIYPCALVYDGTDITANVCAGGSAASLVVNASGSQGSTTYMLDDNMNANGIYNGLSAGTYTLTITDATVESIEGEECTITDTIEILDPEAVTASIEVTSAILCQGDENGVVTLTGSGGSGAGYTFGTEAGTYDNIDGVISGLGFGNVTFYLQDENNCEGTTDEVFLPQPLAVNVSATTTDASCFDACDGTITASASGGTGNITFEYNDEPVVGNMVGGICPLFNQFIIGIDENGCEGTTQPLTILSPDELVLVEQSTADITCPDGTDGLIDVQAAGGSGGGFTYSIDGETFISDSEFLELGADDYVITVVDGNDCQSTLDISLTQPDAFDLSEISSTDITCFGDDNGTASILVTGGNGGITISFDGNEFGETTEFTDLQFGDYTVIAQDSEGCTVDSSVTIVEPDELTVDAVITNESAANEEDGSIETTVTGGTGDYTFSWTGDDGFTASTEDLDDLPMGEYTGVVTDENGCSVTVVLNVIVGIEELTNEISFSVSPNPTNAQLVLVIEGAQGEKLGYTITDATGKIVADNVIENNYNVVTERIDLSSVANGMYFLTLQANASSSTVKVIKH